MREATKEERESINNHIKGISQKVITIPDGTTNGDVIETVFPQFEVSADPYSPSVDIFVYDTMIMRVDRNIWNAPYEKG